MKLQPFTISGRVMKGLQKACALGYPTANLALETPPDIAHGVYFGYSAISETLKNLPSIIFYGIPYTIRETLCPRFEVHILNKKMLNLYDSTLTVRCEKFVRKNKKFASAQALSLAIQKDLERAKQYFSIR